MNIIEKYRIEHGLSYDKMAAAVGIRKSAVWRHCKNASTVRPESAINYEKVFGIPRFILRPDLWAPPPASSTSAPVPSAEGSGTAG